MKNCVILVAILFSGMLLAQETNPTLEIVGQRVKTTYYYENGKVQQDGFFKNGKLDGVWTSYDTNGNKTAIGEYTNGVKTGKWLFMNDNKVSEVNFDNNKITSVKNSKKSALVNQE